MNKDKMFSLTMMSTMMMFMDNERNPVSEPAYKVKKHKTPQHIQNEIIAKAQAKRDRKRIKRLEAL